MRRQWKKIVSRLAEEHRNHGAGIVMIETASPVGPHQLLEGEGFVNVSKDEDLLEVEGSEVPPKEVRTWLWNQRNKRATQRSRGILWSVYDEGTTTVGLGAVTRAAGGYGADES